MWKKSFGEGASQCISTEFGIPDKSYLWEINSTGDSFVSAIFVIDEHNLYYQDDERNVVAIDIYNGSQQWLVPAASDVMPRIQFDNKYLFVAPNIIDKNTGKYIANINELKNITPFSEYGSKLIVDGCLIREIDDENKPGLYLSYNLESGQFSEIELPIQMPSFSYDDKYIFGWKNNQLVYYNFSTKEIVWSKPVVDGNLFDIDPAVFCNRQFVCVLAYTTLTVLDIKYGNKKFEIALHELDKNFEKYKGTSILLSAIADDIVYIKTNENIFAFDLLDARLLWKKSENYETNICVAGDLIFGLVDRYFIVALDRYTGEELWKVKNRLPVFGIKASNNKLFVNSSHGTMTCFEWSTPYHSPARLPA